MAVVVAARVVVVVVAAAVVHLAEAVDPRAEAAAAAPLLSVGRASVGEAAAADRSVAEAEDRRTCCII